MSEKQLYLCLLEIKSQDKSAKRVRLFTASVSSSEAEAKQKAIDEARLTHPDHAHLPIEISAYSFKRSILEQAATEILGWKPPTG
ncbi:MAG TPA: hypothetical protein VF658_21760 [Pyrinomonadaceae bacterium]|jgi:hypothetical protein